MAQSGFMLILGQVMPAWSGLLAMNARNEAVRAASTGALVTRDRKKESAEYTRPAMPPPLTVDPVEPFVVEPLVLVEAVGAVGAVGAVVAPVGAVAVVEGDRRAAAGRGGRGRLAGGAGSRPRLPLLPREVVARIGQGIAAGHRLAGARGRTGHDRDGEQQRRVRAVSDTRGRPSQPRRESPRRGRRGASVAEA